MARHRASEPEIDRIPYEPPGGYALGVELFTLSDFRRRVSRDHMTRAQRLDFHEILFVTKGRCDHMVDFETWTCKPGTLLVLRPGQVQRFDSRARACEGWMVLFRPDFLPEVGHVSVHRVLSTSERSILTATVEQMSADTRLVADQVPLSHLLRHQLSALLVRLRLAEADRIAAAAPAAVMKRFQSFRDAVDRDLDQAHRVSDYARLLGCSPRSLHRASLEAAGLSAKAFLSGRVVLEARRLLAHTDEPVAAIAEILGFDEATNFVKFFRRETGQAPGAFRREHLHR